MVLLVTTRNERILINPDLCTTIRRVNSTDPMEGFVLFMAGGWTWEVQAKGLFFHKKDFLKGNNFEL